MVDITRFFRAATVAAIGGASLCMHSTQASDKKESDPWFTQEHKHPFEEKKQTTESITAGGETVEPTVSLTRKSPASLIRRARKELQSVPDSNLGKRITLLQQITNSERPRETELAQLRDLTALRLDALSAINTASQSQTNLSESISALSPYSQYYKGDSNLLVTLLKSEFSTKLDTQVSSLSRRNQATQLAQIKENIHQAGLSPIFGSRIQTSVGQATSSMLARRWAELLDESKPLPGEAFLMSKLLGHDIGKLNVALEIPPTADPRLSNSIARGLQRAWGNNFHFTQIDNREFRPEFILEIDVDRIQSSNTISAREMESTIPGAVVEEPNPDFLDLVERYEKAAENYQVALSHYEVLYDDYIEALNNEEYRDAQQNLQNARETLAITPLPTTPNSVQSREYSAAVAQVQNAEAVANSIPEPMAIEPTPPTPHHHKILEDMHLVPSTIIISAEEAPYVYTEKNIDFAFEAAAPVSLSVPLAKDLSITSKVSLDLDKEWTTNEGVHPRDPAVDSGTYSETEYQSTLDMFGLEFATLCARELNGLITSVKDKWKTQADPNSLEDTLLFLSMKAASSDIAQIGVNERELRELTELALNPQTQPEDFRSACLEILLAKTEFSHLADREKIGQML